MRLRPQIDRKGTGWKGDRIRRVDRASRAVGGDAGMSNILEQSGQR